MYDVDHYISTVLQYVSQTSTTESLSGLYKNPPIKDGHWKMKYK